MGELRRHSKYILIRRGSLDVFVMVACLALLGCRTKQVIVPEYHYNSNTIYDSVYVHDSISTAVKQGKTDSGVRVDTFFKDRWHMAFQLKRDSVIKRDSIPKPYPVRGETVTIHELYWWQTGLCYFGVVSLIALIIYGYFKIKK